jgi:hypothetical protein
LLPRRRILVVAALLSPSSEHFSVRASVGDRWIVREIRRLSTDMNGDPGWTLSNAIRRGEPLPVVQEIVEQWPDAAANKVGGSYALHEAVQFDSPLEVVKLVYEACPGIIQQYDEYYDTLPLHLLGPETPLAVVEFLVDAYPEALLMRGGEGGFYGREELPVHTAIFANASMEVVTLFVERNRDALLMPNNDGMLPIHVAAGGTFLMEGHPQQLELVRYLAEQCPVSVETLSRSPAPQSTRGNDVDGDEGQCPRVQELAIHVAARSFLRQRLEITQYLAARYPESLGVATTNGGGELPVHLAARTPGPRQLEVIQFLAQQSPESLRLATQNDDGELPLQLAARMPGPEQLDVIRFLAQEYPESLGAATGHGKLLVHLALGSCSAPAVVEHLLESLPEEVPDETRLGLVHCAVRSVEEIVLIHFSGGPGQCLLQSLNVLAAALPMSLRTTDSQGWLPIHVAVHLTSVHHLSADLVERLAELDPGSLLVASNDGDLPLHIAVAGEDQRKRRNTNGFPLTTVLLQRSPLSARVAGRDGNCPIHTAIALRKFPLVHLMAQLDPEASRTVGAGERTPLHVAAALPRFNPSEDNQNGDGVLDAVRLLIGTWQESLILPDANGDLPIHVAIARLENDGAAEVVPAMPERDPHQQLPTEDDGNNDGSFEMIKLLVDGGSGALSKTGADGIVPLRLAIRNRAARLDVIYYLLRTNPLPLIRHEL